MNSNIISQVEIICDSKFTNELNDFFGDRGGAPLPSVESLPILCFKWREKNFFLSKNNLVNLLDQIKTIKGVTDAKWERFVTGKYICVYVDKENAP